MKPPILILHAPGTNRDGDLARAFELAGGRPEIVPLSQLRRGEARWQDYAMLALPGGFSYGDALGGGRLWALDLQTWFAEAMQAFVESGKPVIGICNGFQALVKSHLLPGDGQKATLTFNASGHFECRWVNLVPSRDNQSPWLEGITAIMCPVAHGEGRFLMDADGSILKEQVALVYAKPDGTPAEGLYPSNPNGSLMDIAGITNARGNVLGMMPHPEDHVYGYQHPAWTRGEAGRMGLPLFIKGVRFASQV
jgi:phosphoribosylformylglycinamidine synthase